MRIFATKALLAVALLQLSAQAQAQDRKSSITGTVTDAGHAVLKGARITLDPGPGQTVTDVQGKFTISNLAPAEYTLTVSYVGLSTFTRKVAVKAGEVAQVEAELQVPSQADSITVTAERPRGEAAAINRERTADNIVQVVTAEVITSLPNTNIADAVGRLPSVSVERDEGEGKYVQIRGTEPRLSNTTINGVNVPSPEGGVRNIKLDVIPSDLVESIEVSKTLSANQDGDAIGGSINLVTKSAGDLPTLTVSGLGGGTPIWGGRPVSQFAATSGMRFGREKKLGVLFGGTYDFNGRGISDIEPGPAVTGTMDIRDYKYSRTRFGFGGGLDYRLGAGSSLYLKGLFSDFKNYGERWVYTPNVNDFVTQTTTLPTGQETFNASIRRPDLYVSSVNGGGHHNFGSTLFDWEVSVSRSGGSGGDPQTNFDGPDGVQYALDLTNPNLPKFKVVNGVNIYDPKLYTMTSTQTINYDTAQTNIAGLATLTRHYSAGGHFGSFEAGIKIRNAKKHQNNATQYYTPVGTISLDKFIGTATDPNYYDGSYTLGPLADYSKITDYFNAHPDQFKLNVNTTHQKNDPNIYDTTERVFAEYLMNTLDFGKIRLQTGIRFETTQSNFTGNHVTLDTKGNYVSTSPVTGNQTYTDPLPSIQFIYKLDNSSNIRAAYGRGIARPQFGQLPPYISESDKAKSISIGNPSLLPTRANNYDLLYERYLNPIGIIQAGFFYKDLSNPIYSVQTVVTSGTYAGFKQTQPVNGASAKLYGFEAAWQQRLSFLPGPMNGLGVLANYSWTTSEAVVPGRTDNPALLRQGPNNWNLGFTYDKGRVAIRVGISHNDAYIYSYAYSPSNSGPFDFTDGSGGGIKGPNGDNYLYAHTQVDAQGSYRVSKSLQIVVSGLNLNNEVFGFYNGSPQYPNQREFYHPTYSAGFRWTPFSEKR